MKQNYFIPTHSQYLAYSPAFLKSLTLRPALFMASRAVYRLGLSSAAAKISIQSWINLKHILVKKQINLQSIWKTPFQPGAMGGAK